MLWLIRYVLDRFGFHILDTPDLCVNLFNRWIDFLDSSARSTARAFVQAWHEASEEAEGIMRRQEEDRLGTEAAHLQDGCEPELNVPDSLHLKAS
jgi:hypothetical protein